MRRWKSFVQVGFVLGAVLVWTLTTLAAHSESRPGSRNGWFQNKYTREGMAAALARYGHRPGRIAPVLNRSAAASAVTAIQEGRRLFDHETFGGNGRTCQTCHSEETGTVSPNDAQLRFKQNPSDPLFVHDGSDDDDGDGFGDGQHVTRMLDSATILMRIELHQNVSLLNDPSARS
jgi:hypothetical protein